MAHVTEIEKQDEEARDSQNSQPYSEIIDEIDRWSSPRPEFYVMNLFAAAVASYGLLSNSTAVTIGAMVIAVLLGPISGIGLSIVIRDASLLKRAAFTLITGTIEVLFIAFVIGKLHHQVPLTPELLSRTQPNLFDLMIALSGGAAGAYALGRRVPGGSLIGVAIATALVPPLCSAAIAASHGSWHLSQQAFLLFITNLVAIQCAYSIVLYALDVLPIERSERRFRKLVKNMAPSLVLLIALGAVLTVVLEGSIVKQQRDTKVRTVLSEALRGLPGSYLGDLVVTNSDSSYAVVASVRTPSPIGPDTVRVLEQSIASSLDHPVTLTVRSMLMRVADRNGYLFAPEQLQVALDQPQAGTLPDTSKSKNADSAAHAFDSLVQRTADSSSATDSLKDTTATR